MLAAHTTSNVKILIAIAFIAAGCFALLSQAGVLSATSLVPPVLFGAGLVLVLLHLINAADRRY